MARALSSASNWGTFDLLGGGLLATAMKHEMMGAARALLTTAQSRLHVFQREVGDVDVRVDVDVEMDELTAFADYFLDNIFSDWAVQSKIDRSLAGVRQAEARLGALLVQLSGRLGATDARIAQIAGEREALLQRWG